MLWPASRAATFWTASFLNSWPPCLFSYCSPPPINTHLLCLCAHLASWPHGCGLTYGSPLLKWRQADLDTFLILIRAILDSDTFSVEELPCSLRWIQDTQEDLPHKCSEHVSNSSDRTAHLGGLREGTEECRQGSVLIYISCFYSEVCFFCFIDSV